MTVMIKIIRIDKSNGFNMIFFALNSIKLVKN